MKPVKPLLVPVAALIIAGAALTPVFAQEQAPDQGRGNGPGFGIGAVLECSANNPTDTAAKALGMTATELRQALVSGKSISDIAASKNVDIKTVTDALSAEMDAELQQAVKDGLLTQAQYDQIAAFQKERQAAQGNQGNQGGMRRFGLRIPAHNIVNNEIVAAKALNMSCADLVKAVQGGKAIAQVATDKNVAVQTVIDAVVAAHKDALAQDVKEGLITQAQADGRMSDLTTAVGTWVYSTNQGRGFGGFPGFGGPGFGGRGPGGQGFPGGRGGPNGQPPQQGQPNGQPPQPGQPNAPATPPATPAA